MADDGMLINFHIGDEVPKAQPTFKGGQWRDRRAANKSVIRNRRNSTNEQNTSQRPGLQSLNIQAVDPENIDTRAVKRPRLSNSEARDRHALTDHFRSTKNASTQPRQVISSLFTYNPESKNREQVGHVEGDTEAVEPTNAPLQSELDTFTSLGLSPHLAAHLLQKLNIKAPTAIQRAAVSQLVHEGGDAFIQAETGSGKTLAYLLPIVQRLLATSSHNKNSSASDNGSGLRRDSGLFAIVLAPTRELGKQISVVLEDLLRCAHWLVSGTVLGGEKKKSEKARLRKGLNILIATPGRLVDHLDNTKVLNVSNVRWLVLDEGDRLMDLGFEQDIRKIVSKLNFQGAKMANVPGFPERRSTILCSATMKSNVEQLGEISLRDAVHIQADRKLDDLANTNENQRQNDFTAPAQLKQSFSIVPAKQRLVSLTALLRRSFARHGSVMKAIIFLSCADSVDFHFEVFSMRPGNAEVDEKGQEQADDVSVFKPKGEVPAQSFRTNAEAVQISSKENPVQVFRLHGSLPQPVRASTLRSFSRCKEAAFLVCTDVASRGLDLPNVDLIVEYDPPFSKDEHLHRIGRTARAGKDGRASIFLLPGSEEGYTSILEQVHGVRSLVQHETNDMLKKGFGSTGIGAGKDWESHATDWQLEVERWVQESPKYLEMARRAYQSHIRAYATHVSAERKYFDMQQLHLGHLAKAFALRDKPGSIRVPGLRPNQNMANATKSERRAKAGKTGTHGEEPANQGQIASTDVDTARKKMRSKIKEMGGASEFNIG